MYHNTFVKKKKKKMCVEYVELLVYTCTKVDKTLMFAPNPRMNNARPGHGHIVTLITIH